MRIENSYLQHAKHPVRNNTQKIKLKLLINE